MNATQFVTIRPVGRLFAVVVCVDPDWTAVDTFCVCRTMEEASEQAKKCAKWRGLEVRQ